MKMKVIATCAFFLNTVLFATYYSVAKEALGRIEPIVFTYFEVMALVPAGLCILVLCWQDINRQVLKRGVLLGSSLCLAIFTIAVALKYTSATGTAFFPALNGFLAAFAAWIFFQRPITKATWFAGLLSVVGAALLIMNSPMGGARGAVIAFVGGLLFTGYVFLSEHQQPDETNHWPLFAIELLTMAVWANLIVLLFGDWQAVHPAMPKDVWVILYVAGACTFIPTLIAAGMQKYISAVTVSFIYILEPVLGAVMANIYLHETLPLDGYIGGGLIVVGAIIHTWSSTERPARQVAFQQSAKEEPKWLSLLATVGYALLFLGAGTFILSMLGGFPPPVWYDVSRLWPTLPALMQQGQHTAVLLLVVQAACWLIAWVSLALIALVTIYRVLRILFSPRPGARPFQQVNSNQQPIPVTEDLAADWYGGGLPYSYSGSAHTGMYQREYQTLEVRER